MIGASLTETFFSCDLELWLILPFKRYIDRVVVTNHKPNIYVKGWSYHSKVMVCTGCSTCSPKVVGSNNDNNNNCLVWCSRTSFIGNILINYSHCSLKRVNSDSCWVNRRTVVECRLPAALSLSSLVISTKSFQCIDHKWRYQNVSTRRW